MYFTNYFGRLEAVLVDGVVDQSERTMLAQYALDNSVSEAQHLALLKRAGWAEDEYREGVQRRASSPAE